MDASQNQTIKLFITQESECSYLPHKLSRSAFIDPELPLNSRFYTALLNNGFRRSGNEVYRPHCKDCTACIPVRVDVKQYQPNRSQKRIFAKNKALRLRFEREPLAETHFQLYERYITARHQDGGMYPPDLNQFYRFLGSNWAETALLCAYLDENLVAVMVSDIALDGLSAVYSFFDPDLASLSLGTYLVMGLFQQCESMELPYCYLGYYVKDCQKMNYKNAFQPMEYFVQGTWLSTIND